MARAEWFEDDAFWIDFYDFLFSEQRRAQAEERVATSPLLAFAPGARVLDLCCGSGVYTTPLARHGYQVTGVDVSAPLLARAAEAARAAGVAPRLVETDALEFLEPGAFDAVVSMFNSFGYFTEHADNVRLLRNARASLAPGGQLLVDLAGKEILAAKVHTPNVLRRPSPDGPDAPEDLLIQYDTVLDDWARLRSDWVLVRGADARRESLVWYVYSGAELRGMAREAGFAEDEIEILGGFDGRPYDEHAERLILRATRREAATP